MNKKILIMFLSMFMISMTFATTNDATLYYSYDTADTTGTTMLDITGNLNNGTCTNMASNCNTVSGLLEQASSFDGSNDYIDTNTQIDSANGTLSLWVNPDAFGSGVYAVSDRSASGDYMFIFLTNTGVVRYRIVNGGTNTIDSSITINTTEWSFITATWGSGGMELFINGKSKGTAASTSTWTQTTDTLIGDSIHAPATNAYDGLIDETSYYTRELTTGEILELYNSGVGFNPYAVNFTIETNLTNGEYFNNENISIEVNTTEQSDAMFYYLNNTNWIVEEGLVAYYPFDGDYNDASSNTNDGTNSGTVLVNDSSRLDYLLMPEFDGSASEITISDFLTAPSGISLNTWINPDDLTGNVFEAITWQNWNYRMYIDDDENDLQCLFINSTGAGIGLDTNQVITAGTWQYTSCIWNGTHLKAYYNGNEVGTPVALTTVREETTDFYLGSVNTAHFFDGTMDEVRIYNRGLTETEVELLYNESPYTKICDDCNNSFVNLYNLAEKNYNISFLAIADQTIATLEQNFNIDLTNPIINDSLPAEINSYFLNISQYVSCTDANLLTCNITFTPDGKTSPVTNESYEFTYNGNQSYNIIAEDNAGNIVNKSGVILVNPIASFRINDSLTGQLVDTFTFGSYSSNNSYVQIPFYDLGLGNQSLLFKAFGYNSQNFSFTLTNTSRINITYNATPTTLNIKMFDALTLQQLTFNTTVLNITNTETFLNQVNMSKRYNETPTGDITIIINSQGYKEARYFNTLTNATSITIFGYLFQDNATDVEVVQFFTRETGTDKNLDGVLIEAQRIINGSLTTITQATTDDSGATFMWLDTSLTYSFIFSKTGYATSTANSIPGVNSYTVKMERDVDAREYIDGINIMFTPSLDRVNSNPNPNFRTFITGVSITSMTYELIDQNGTVIYTDTSTNPTGTTFNRTLNVSGYTQLTQKITYIIDGTTNVKQKTYKIISIDAQNFLEYMKTFNDTTDEGTNIFVWIVMFISIGGAFMVGSKIGQPSLFVIATSAFFTFTEWMPLPYFGVISFSAIIFWMAFGGTK